MAKPMFLIGLSNPITQEELLEAQKRFEHKMPDYYVLIYTHNNSGLEFKAFYEKDFDDVKFEELKAMVLKEMSK